MAYYNLKWFITVKKDVCKIHNPTKVDITIVKKLNSNRLFPLRIKSIQSFFVAEVKDPLWLWHLGYGHLSVGSLRTPQ